MSVHFYQANYEYSCCYSAVSNTVVAVRQDGRGVARVECGGGDLLSRPTCLPRPRRDEDLMYFMITNVYQACVCVSVSVKQTHTLDKE